MSQTPAARERPTPPKKTPPTAAPVADEGGTPARQPRRPNRPTWKCEAPRRTARAAAAGAAAVVRGALIAALDDQFLNGRLGVVLCQGDPTPEARKLVAALRDCPTEAAGFRLLRDYMFGAFQAAMHGLFPEEFGGPGDGPGVCPPGGPKRVGGKRLRAFVAKVCALHQPRPGKVIGQWEAGG